MLYYIYSKGKEMINMLMYEVKGILFEHTNKGYEEAIERAELLKTFVDEVEV
jgi:hypothetical protein